MDILTDFLSRHYQKLITLSTIALVILITLSIADTTLFVLDEVMVNQPEAIQESAQRNVASTTLSLSSLAEMNLFGAIDKAPPANQVKAPETKLNLELQGVFSAEDQSASMAIVAEKNKSGVLYKIGDRLPGNVILNAVFDDYILMKRGSRFEKLSFSDDAFRSQAASSKPPARRSRVTIPNQASKQRTTRNTRNNRRADRRTTQADVPITQPISRPGKAKARSIGEFIRDNKERIQSDPEALLTDLGIQPVAAGEASGYRVDGSIPSELLQRSGLRQGDVILSVNGQAVGSAMSDAALIDSAMASGRVRVEVQRASKRFFVTVPVK